MTMQCPTCGKMTGLVVQVKERHDAYVAEYLSEGLNGYSQMQCQDPLCSYEWDTVTHSQILRSLSLWSSHSPKGTGS